MKMAKTAECRQEEVKKQPELERRKSQLNFGHSQRKYGEEMPKLEEETKITTLGTKIDNLNFQQAPTTQFRDGFNNKRPDDWK